MSNIFNDLDMEIGITAPQKLMGGALISKYYEMINGGDKDVIEIARPRSIKIGNVEQEELIVRPPSKVDKGTNPLNNKKFTAKYKQISEQVSKLPANDPDLKNQLFATLDKHPLVILSGETGSGKSTQTGKHLLEYFGYQEKIVVTQPRTLNAATISGRVADELDVQLGQEVGYQYHGNKMRSDETMLSFVTDGLLMNELYANRDKLRYQSIIIDEAHERNIYIDFILLYIKEYLLKNPKTTRRFIIMSATLDLEKFQKYFKGISFGTHSIPGRTFPVERNYLDHYVKDYAPLIPEIIINKILKTSDSGDIVVFLTSQAELDTIEKNITTALKEDKILPATKKNIRIFKLYRGVPETEEKLATDKDAYKKLPGNPTRKIVLATNIAETGVTIDGLKYVIDNGRHLEARYNYKKRVAELDNTWITKSAAKQRAGRAGRTAPGICYHLYTEKDAEKMQLGKTPDIQNTKLEKDFLNFLGNRKILLENSTALKKMTDGLIDPPTEEHFNSTFKILENYGLVYKSNTKFIVSELGLCVSDIGANDIETGLLIIVAKMLGVHNPIIRILAMKGTTQFQANKLFIPPITTFVPAGEFNDKNKKIISQNIKKRDTFLKAQKKFANNQSEILGYYNIYDDAISRHNLDSTWLKRNYLRTKPLMALPAAVNELDMKTQEISEKCVYILDDKLRTNKNVISYLKSLDKISMSKDTMQTIDALPLYKKLLIPFIFIYGENKIKYLGHDERNIEVEYNDTKYSTRKTTLMSYFSKNMIFTDITIINDNPAFVGLINV